MMQQDTIISLLPYREPFLFADRILDASPDGISGTYTFPTDALYYQGHFPGNPVTPGVLLIEAAAQIGLVGLAIFLTGRKPSKMAMTSAHMDFLKPVGPGQTIVVTSKKIYFRFGKLKCEVTIDCEGNRVAEGTIEGMAHE